MTDTTDTYIITAAELLQFIERYESLEAERKATGNVQKELMAELAGRGYDKKIFRKLIALRKRQAADVAEEEAILEMYKSAIGME